MSENTESLAKLRAPFAPSDINFLPKGVRKNDQDRFKCEQGQRGASMDGKYCGGFHALSIHLDYVGHAALTARLLDVDPEWTWEPMSTGPDGLPVFDSFGGLWIKLTICGMTRLGYGDAQGKSGANAVKEAIGDALRNAGMRFGAALDLWHKGDLSSAKDEQGVEPPRPGPPPVQAASPPAFDPGWLQAHSADLDKRIYEAKGDVSQLRTIWAWANGTGAPPEVLDRLKAISTGVAA